MKKLLVIALMAGLTSCDNDGEVNISLDSAKTRLDTLTNRIEDSEVIDSVRSKGRKLLDSIESKGGGIMDRLDIEINKKDSTR